MRPKSKEERNLELRKDAARIVAGVENYSGADRVRRAAEVNAAFPPVKAGAMAKAKSATTAKAAVKTVTKAVAKPATKAAVKPAAKTKTKTATKAVARTTTGPAAKTTVKSSSKGPTPAGMSVGPHDGDVC